MFSVSIIIPTLEAERDLDRLLSALMGQNYPIKEILVVDSCSRDNTSKICRAYEKVTLFSVPREAFDHGRIRDMALRRSQGEIAVFLTQDAVPADDTFLRNLIIPLADNSIAISIGRQLPKPDAIRQEALIRSFNYPAVSRIRSADDISSMGIKAYFSSDSCAAYRKDIYLELGGFDYPLKSNEDMFFAAKVLKNGYKISYTADARVYHSHNFSIQEQYTRNFLQGYEIERHKDLLGDASLNREGIQLAKYVSNGLLKEGRVGALLYFGIDCIARWLGNRNGKKAYRREMKTNV